MRSNWILKGYFKANTGRSLYSKSWPSADIQTHYSSDRGRQLRVGFLDIQLLVTEHFNLLLLHVDPGERLPKQPHLHANHEGLTLGEILTSETQTSDMETEKRIMNEQNINQQSINPIIPQDLKAPIDFKPH